MPGECSGNLTPDRLMLQAHDAKKNAVPRLKNGILDLRSERAYLSAVHIVVDELYL
jgi:hypothetical protein